MKPSPGTRAWHRLAAALLLALAAGCGGESKPPLAPVDETPPGNLPPPIETVYPAARSTGVIYDTDIWVRFSEALDPASVNEHTVFFKLDTVRYPVTLTYDAASRTIRVAPGVRLALLRTYTVEITSGVRTASGQALTPGFWQFRTNGLRRLENPVPAPGTNDESPFTYLGWDETEPAAGAVSYKVYAGTDSAAVAARGTPISNVAVGSIIPSQPWGFSTRLYWTVTALNQTSNERLDSPVWSFTTLPAGLPIDSVVVSATEWGQYDRTLNMMTCLGEFIFAGTRYNGGIHWPQREIVPGLKLARARIRMYGVSANPLTGAPSIYAVKDAWASCSYTTFVPSAEGVKLADAFRIGLSPYIAFESDPLTARIEAVGRGGPVYGFSLRASATVSFPSPIYGTDGPLLTLYYYRVPPAPAARPVPASAREP